MPNDNPTSETKPDTNTPKTDTDTTTSGPSPHASVVAKTNERRNAYTTALVSEIRMLVRAISNDPEKRLNNLNLSYQFDGDSQPRAVSFGDMVGRVAAIGHDPTKQFNPVELGFLQAARDALVAVTAPATGLTIAYTTLVSGGHRSANVESSYDLAQLAYGGLTRRAWVHRACVYLLIVVAVLATSLAACEATRAALGKGLLQTLDPLRTQQVAIAAEKVKLEMNLDQPAGANAERSTDPTLVMVPICDRWRIRAASLNGKADLAPVESAGLRLQATPAERDVCGRDNVIGHNIQIAHFNLNRWLESWSTMAGGIFAPVGKLLGKRDLSDVCAAGTTPVAHTPGKSDEPASRDCDDVEYTVTPILQVITNYTLPLVFGFIGSVLYVLLDHFNKMRKSELSPKDLPLMGMRLILGLVIAACVSLLISSYSAPGPAAAGPADGIPSAGSLVATLTLSAAGVAFLAGFGAEAVFVLLQNLVQRVFAMPKS